MHGNVVRTSAICRLLFVVLGLSSAHAVSAATLSLSGQPPISAIVGQSYYFKPKVSGTQSQSVRFTIQNKPTWLTFNSRNGALSGTPTAAQVGTYSRILIKAYVRKMEASLPAFNISVQQGPAPAPTPGNGSATVSWKPPLRNVDGTLVTSLNGYRVIYGTDPNRLGTVLDVPSSSITSVRIEELAVGTWYFAVKAYAGRTESAPSATVWKTIN
jgi:hypothetical protein